MNHSGQVRGRIRIAPAGERQAEDTVNGIIECVDDEHAQCERCKEDKKHAGYVSECLVLIFPHQANRQKHERIGGIGLQGQGHEEQQKIPSRARRQEQGQHRISGQKPDPRYDRVEPSRDQCRLRCQYHQCCKKGGVANVRRTKNAERACSGEQGPADIVELEVEPRGREYPAQMPPVVQPAALCEGLHVIALGIEHQGRIVVIMDERIDDLAATGGDQENRVGRQEHDRQTTPGLTDFAVSGCVHDTGHAKPPERSEGALPCAEVAGM